MLPRGSGRRRSRLTTAFEVAYVADQRREGDVQGPDPEHGRGRRRPEQHRAADGQAARAGRSAAGGARGQG